MWGGTREAAPEMAELLRTRAPGADFHADAYFLKEALWPLMLDRGVLQHDSFSCAEFGAEPFPTARKGAEHVGAVILDGKMRASDVEVLLEAIASPEAVACS